MKKFNLYTAIPVILLATASAPSLAADAFCDGWFAGVSIGGASRGGRINSDSTFTTTFAPGGVVLTGNRSAQANLRKNAFLGAISLGYGWTFCDEYYAAFEAFISGSKHKHRHANVSTSTSLVAPGATIFSDAYSTSNRSKLNSFEWGIDFKPGFLIGCNTLLYGRLGVGFNKLAFNSDNTYGFASPTGLAFTDTINSSVGAGHNRKRGAFRIGLGIERRFCECWSVRLDYAHTRYGTITRTTNSTGTATIGTVATATISGSNTTRIKVDNNVTTLGLFYYW